MITPTQKPTNISNRKFKRMVKKYSEKVKRRNAINRMQMRWKLSKLLKRKPSGLTPEEIKKEKLFRKHYILDFEEDIIDSIYEAQWRDAKDIYASFLRTQTLLVNLIKQPQEGKTGIVVALLYLIAKKDINYKYSLKNTYYVTGVSSTEWVAQQTIRFPECFEKNILHRPQLQKDYKLHDILTNTKNPFIIIDEAFWAAGAKQTFGKIFDETYKGKNRNEEQAKNNVKLLLTSATPDGTLPDTRKDYGDQGVILVPDPVAEYWGPQNWINTRTSDRCRLFQYQDLDNEKNILDLRSFISMFYNEYKYHCIRIHGGGRGDVVMQKIKDIFGPDFAYYEFNEESKHDGAFLHNSKIPDINVLLKQKPSCHSIVFIKEKARCSTTLVKKNLGVVYERLAKTPSMTIINQGFIGRSNGYDVNEDVVVFTDVDEVERYVEYRNRIKNGSEKYVPHKSRTTDTIFDKDEQQNVTRSKGTYLDPDRVKNGKKTRTLPKWMVEEFIMKPTDTLKNIKNDIDQWLREDENNNRIYGSESRKKPLVKRINGYNKNDDGFWYLDTHYNKDRNGVYKVYAKSELDTESKELRNGQNNNPTRLFPTYDDLTNPHSTCTWKLFYRIHD